MFRRIITCAAILGCACQVFAQDNDQVSDELRIRAVEIMRTTMQNEAEWVKVHAAEYLLALGYRDGVAEEFQSQLEQYGDKPQYRIGIWRVLARASQSDAERASWINNIRAVIADPDSTDHLHATETLAKLNYAADDTEKIIFKENALSEDGALAAFASCILVHSGESDYEAKLVELLDAEEERTRLCAAYALRHITPISPEAAAALASRAQAEAQDSTARGYLLAAAHYHAKDPSPFWPPLFEYSNTGTIAEKREAAEALAHRGTAENLHVLTAMLDDPEADVRATAAYSVLRMARREAHPLRPLDWVAITLYAAAMLGVGWYFARRTNTSEEYLLGGRRMNPITVGLSMFATLLSTLSYLAIPGEMMKHGPMIASQYLAWPLIFLVIAFILIPAILKQRVTSAYEILEIKLGNSVRILGSLFFLSIRFMWMALIVYATSSKVLVPLLQLDASATPYVCTILGIITIAYTSMGGLRAVVITDVMQTVILFGGAILTIIIITINMGGVSQWFPQVWAPNWDPVKFMYDPTARVTIAGAMTSAFVWYICTAGSDQVAIQRYLATKNVSTARRVMAVSMTSDVCVGMFLATLGVALWSYFQANPHMLPDNYQSLQNADTLFPRFIALGLPAGISGLVIAGLLAAAMSSLSSGVNSSCLVITVDFLKQDSDDHEQSHEKKNIRNARLVSIFVGIAVIALSIAAGSIGGNLLEVVYKVANLLVAPLFILFFMALFIPWATSFGTITAGLASAAVAIAIAYFELFGLSFIWIMPGALITGVVIGPIVSLIPIGKQSLEPPNPVS